MSPKISRYISITVISLSVCCNPLSAQDKQASIETLTQQEAPVFGGVAVSADLVGAVMKVSNADYSQMEVAARLNFKGKYFPIFELGYGESNYEGAETGNIFKTRAPYFRIGADYNFTKKWYTGNRLYLGVRYAFTSFNYDVGAPGFRDPVWNMEVPFLFEGLHANSHWGEVVFGIETRIWSIFHLGWSLRYKMRMSHNEDKNMLPWYVPGYGKFGSSCIGGTFNVIFDIGQKSKKQK